MKRSLVALGFVLAAIPPAYAAFVAGWQFVSFLGFAVRLDEGLPGEVWRQIGLNLFQMAAIPVALLVAWREVGARRPRRAGIALGVAWLAAAPLAWMLLSVSRS